MNNDIVPCHIHVKISANETYLFLFMFSGQLKKQKLDMILRKDLYRLNYSIAGRVQNKS